MCTVLTNIIVRCQNGKTPYQLLRMDDVKLKSSVTFFAEVGESTGDKEVQSTCNEVLSFFAKING